MYYKIENKYFWDLVCKQNNEIYLILNVMVEILERFITKNYQKVPTFKESNCIVKHNRIFFKCSDKKLFTFNFPFQITEGGILFNGEIIDIYITKAMKKILDMLKKSDSFESFLLEYDNIDESEGLKVSDIQSASKILKNLFEIEIGYLRYDQDKLASKINGEKYHPEYHLDIFFDNIISCKIGIDNKYFIFDNDMENYLDKLFDKTKEKFFLK